MAQEVFRSLSGSEIHAVFGNVKFADIQMIKYASSRQKAPIYTMGSPDLRAVARGPRSINGALIFSQLSTRSLVERMAEGGSKVFLSNDELANYTPRNNERYKEIKSGTVEAKRAALKAGGSLAVTGTIGPGGFEDGGTFDPFAVGEDIYKSENFGQAVPAFLADQLPPFDITLVGMPETAGEDYLADKYRPQSLIIRGVEFVSEASGSSIQDMVIEKQMSFIARSIQDWEGVTF